MRCKACRRDIDKGVGQSYGAIIACQRMHQKSKQWWEREPGWFWRERRPRPTPLGKPATVLCLPMASRKQIIAELARQSKRLAGQPDITFAEAA